MVLYNQITRDQIVNMKVHHKMLLLLLSYIIFISTSYAAATTITTSMATTSTKKPPSLILKLIHRHSVLSPWYNPNATTSDRANQNLESSNAGMAYINTETKSSSAIKDYRGSIIAASRHNLFFVNLSLSDASVPQLVAMDTGSNLLWVHCLPCIECDETLGPIFDPAESYTYRKLPCNSPYCANSIEGMCDSEKRCQYTVKYDDNESRSWGSLASETLTFITSDEGTIKVPNMVFGCGHHSFINDPQANGIMGLGADTMSLASQLGTKFSYCIGNISDPHYSHNQLILGDMANVELGYKTAIEVYDGKYYLSLEGISVGQKRLDIDPQTFKSSISSRGKRIGGVIIDSGTTLTLLTRNAFELFRKEVQNLIDGLFGFIPLRILNRPNFLCYRGIGIGSLSQDMKGFPTVTFHFAGGADMELDADNMFFNLDPGEFCMAVDLSEDKDDRSFIGVTAQQYFNVGYDLSAMRLSFQKIDCELLEQD